METVFRTNSLDAYNRGRHEQMSDPKVIAARPVWEIRALEPTTPEDRQTHIAANGKKLLASDPFWRTAYPPFGFNCRCRVVSRNQASLADVVPGTSIQGLPDPGFSSGIATLLV